MPGSKQIVAAMAAEGGGSKIESTQNDECVENIDNIHRNNSAELKQNRASFKRLSNDESVAVVSTGADPEENETRLCGWLNKCGNIGFVKTARRMWFVFSDDNCKLYFYRNRQDLLPLGEIDIMRASFYFDANSQRPGAFEIRSDGKVYSLDAQSQKKMTFWLEELQKKRKQYSTHRKTISSEKMSWTLKNRRKGSGLTGQTRGKSFPPTADDDVSPAGSGSHGDDFMGLSSEQDIHNLSPNSKSRYWSMLNLRSEIRDVVSNIRTQILPTTGSKPSSPPSPSSETKSDDWTVLEQDAEPASQSAFYVNASQPQPIPAVTPKMSASASYSTGGAGGGSGVGAGGTKFGGKLAKMFKPGKRSQSDSSAPKENQKSQRIPHSSGTQTCYKCKTLQEDLVLAREDLRVTEEELEANREIIKLLQKELDVIRVAMETRKDSEGKSDEEKDLMLQQRDKHVVELEHSLAVVQDERSLFVQQIKEGEDEVKTLQDQVAMLQDMLIAKDEAIVKLTNQIFELENSAGKEDGQTSSEVFPPREPLLMADARELTSLRDSVRAYKAQNDFLTKEITELTELRALDEKREKELLINHANLDALYCQTRSKYLVLLKDNEPVRGGEEAQSQEVVAQLLQEALDTEAELGASKNPEAQLSPLSSHSQQYDRYGFLVCDGEVETDDILVAKANQLQRQSDELNSHIRDVSEITSKHIKWENFMVGQSGKPLVRSPELKTLIRMGVPHEFREHIWKGCINFYVGQTRDKLGPMYYKKDLGERIKNSKSNPAVKQIELDLLRTLPTNCHFDSVESDGVPKLRRVLLSYSVHNPLIGYCQGLNRLAAIALLFLSEEEAFWCLEAVVEHILPKEYYTKTLAAAQADQRVLKDLVADKLPRLNVHLEQHNVDLSLYTFNWFLTIFVDNVRPETFLRCWDALLYEGSKVLFRFALGFLKYAEEEILTLSEARHIFRYMRMLGEKITDVKKITHIAFHDVNPLPMRSVSNKRVYHMQKVQEELQELDIIRQDFQSSHTHDGRQGYVSEDDLDDTREEEEEEVEEAAES